MEIQPVSTLFINGTVGVGKSTIATTISDLLNEFDAILTQSALQDFSVLNEDRAQKDVAIDVLRLAGWLSNADE